MQVTVLNGRKIVLLALAAIGFIWAIIAFDLLTLFRQPSGFNPEALVIETGPRATAGIYALLASGLAFSLLISLLSYLAWRNQRHHAEQLRLQRRIFDHTSEAMMLTDLAHRILAVNRAFEAVTGYSAAEVIGKTPKMLRSGRHEPAFYQAIWARVAESGLWEGEIWDRHKEGQISPRQLRIQLIREEMAATEAYYLAIFSDASLQKAQEARLEYLAHHDPLTHLPNRLAMELKLSQCITLATRAATQLAVLVIDLDNFKTVNDSLGHHAGDRLLNQMAHRLQALMSNSAHLFRLGGDEFVVIQENLSQLEPVVELVQGLVRAIGEPCEIDGHQLHISPSIGISLFPADGADAETLIRNADTAMYHAKASGRNNYQFFAEPMNAAANKRLHLESELWQALADKQLLLHYQPQVDLLSGKIVGVEALVRWQHPQRGMIAPSEFIPIAEECGLILPLGHWVLRTACQQARTWLDNGVDIGEIAVNISAHQFRQPDFAQLVQAVLLETGLPAERLELEITESTVMHSAESSERMLADLKAMGIKLAIDDFGTGYSSLSYLRRFSVDRLKIDRSFVADVESDSDAASLVSSIVALGRSLGLYLVAEGVENAAQADFLRALDCQRVQGFHFFRPVSADEVSAVSDFMRPMMQTG